MSTRHLLDPELWPLVDATPVLKLNAGVLPAVRANMAQTTVLVDAAAQGVTRREVGASMPGATAVRCLVYEPAKAAADTARAAYLHIHGGGYVLGTPEMADEMNVRVCAELGVVVVSVDYRLAPEHPIPAPLDDCYTALAWLATNAADLKVDPARIGVGGESAGGGLAAALALRARDTSEYAVCCQHLVYPMLDDRTGSEAAPGDPLVGEFVWTRTSNTFAWDSYLAGAQRAAPQVPARAETLAGLPPTWLLTVGLDLFRDENIAYAQRLMAAGVVTELAVYPGACHGFQGLPGTNLRARYGNDYIAGLGRGLGCPAA